MAERRRAGDLRAQVLRAIAAAPRPPSAGDIAGRLRAGDNGIAASAVFRAIRQLLDAGAIHKILSGRVYAVGKGTRLVMLVCEHCGQVETCSCNVAFDRLEAIGAAQGFSVSQLVIEVPGRCRDCAQGSSGLDVVPGDR